MERGKQKTVNMTEEFFKLTEEDIKHLLKSEEDIKQGRVYTTEEVIKYLEKECGFKYIEK